MIPDELFNKVVHALESHEWIFAKTMPENPHWYTLRKSWDDNEFVEVVKVIREYGYDAWYKGRKYRQFDANGMFYWTMGDTLDRTILINRKPLTP
jgi:hypothetical protein